MPRRSVVGRASWPRTATPPGGAAGREPALVVGNPGPRLFEAAAATVGIPPGAAVVIGDGQLTDIRAAHAVGARSVLMMTGVTTAAHLADVPPDERPTAVAPDAGELATILDRFPRGHLGGPTAVRRAGLGGAEAGA